MYPGNTTITGILVGGTYSTINTASAGIVVLREVLVFIVSNMSAGDVFTVSTRSNSKRQNSRLRNTCLTYQVCKKSQRNCCTGEPKHARGREKHRFFFEAQSMPGTTAVYSVLGTRGIRLRIVYKHHAHRGARWCAQSIKHVEVYNTNYVDKANICHI